LWFQALGDGAFKQFATAPYGECHWDLLRWGPGKRGVLAYLGTRAECYSDHTGIDFRPGIAFMPKTWQLGRPWSDRGVSHTVYSENGVRVCDGTNTWRSRVVGLVEMRHGGKAVHTQTNEHQALSPLPGAPTSSACPPGRETVFDWQENYYIGASISVRATGGEMGGASIADDAGLARSVGGNLAATRAVGHPEWDSNFTRWVPLPPRGIGTLTVAPRNVANASSGNTIVLTYTAPAAGLKEGEVWITVPPGWSAPVTTNAAGCTTATDGTVTTSGQMITVSGLTLPPNGRAVVRYGASSGGSCAPGDGAVASSTPGAPVWRAEARSGTSEIFTNFPATPSVNVSAADGSGTLTIAATSLTARSTGNTLRFTYTASAGGLTNGAVMITVAPGWTPPVTGNAAGCATSTRGTVTTSGSNIVVSNLTVAANTSVVIDYGATAGGACGGGDGVTAPPVPAAYAFSAQETSTADGTFTPLGASPLVIVG
jgi:hypothetical protein